MTMTPRVRKFALTAHVTSSVGWLGSIGAFLALAIAGLISADAQMVRAAYLASEWITWWVIIPLAFASLLTGLVMSLGTPWGLFRHYWVLAKLLITTLATVLLLVHAQPIGQLADIARKTGTLSGSPVHQLQIQLVSDAGAALLALFVNVTLSVYKPRGLTRYGRRTQPDPSSAKSNGEPNDGIDRTPRWVKVFGIIAGLLILWFVAMHLTGHGLGGHTGPTRHDGFGSGHGG